MEPKIGRTFLFYKMACEIWQAVQEVYSDLENTTQSFQVRSLIRTTKQDTNSVTEYFNTLIELWQESDLFHDIKWECAVDSTKYENMVEKERVFDSLHGLNSDLDEVRGRLLGTKPFPTMREVFEEVRREESRKKVMFSGLGQSNNEVYSSASALSSFREKPYAATKGENTKENQWCEYCNRPYHTNDMCWKIHGKLAGWKPKSQRKEA